MAYQKIELSALTINQLSQLTGKNYRKIKNQLRSLKPMRKVGNVCRDAVYDALQELSDEFSKEKAHG